LWNPQMWDAQVLAPLQDENLGKDFFAELGV
jgi:hypothetical protein